MSAILALLLWITPAHANMILVPPPAVAPSGTAVVWGDTGSKSSQGSVTTVWTDVGSLTQP